MKLLIDCCLASALLWALQWRHNGLDGVSNHQPHHCLLSRLFGRRSKKTSKLRVTGLCAGNSPVPGEFLAQMASNAENVFSWWRHHEWVNNWATPPSAAFKIVEQHRGKPISRFVISKWLLNNFSISIVLAFLIMAHVSTRLTSKHIVAVDDIQSRR